MTLMLALTGLVILAYSGYNLLIKVASDAAPAGATSLIVATITLQLAALATSLLFALSLSVRGGHQLVLNTTTLSWAALAGICIGIAEVAYFYVFRGFDGVGGFPASVVIPGVVAGTIVVTMIVATFAFHETIGVRQLCGLLLVLAGLVLLVTKG